MNKLNGDNFNQILLFLDQRSLANLSVVDKKRYSYFQAISSWPSSPLKPELASTTKDKILGCFQGFLEHLAVNQPSHFLASSPDDHIQFQVEVFCSNGKPILKTRNFIPTWRIPNEVGPVDTAKGRMHTRLTDYQLSQQPQLSMAWGEFYVVRGFSGPSLFTNIDPIRAGECCTSLQQALEERIGQLKANEEGKLIQHFQSLSPEGREQYIAEAHRNLPTFDTLAQRMREGERLARTRSNRSWSQNAARVAVIVAAIGAGIHFLILEGWRNQYS